MQSEILPNYPSRRGHHHKLPPADDRNTNTTFDLVLDCLQEEHQQCQVFKMLPTGSCLGRRERGLCSILSDRKVYKITKPKPKKAASLRLTKICFAPLLLHRFSIEAKPLACAPERARLHAVDKPITPAPMTTTRGGLCSHWLHLVRRSLMLPSYKNHSILCTISRFHDRPGTSNRL